MRTLLTGALVLALLVGAFWLRPGPAVSVGTSFVFPLSVKGTARQTDLAFGPGTKITPDKITDKILGAILRGENTSAYSAQFLDVLHSDPSGRFFLYFDGRGADGSTTWRFATNPNGTMATTVHGAITQDGFFWLAGQYTLPVLGTRRVPLTAAPPLRKNPAAPSRTHQRRVSCLLVRASAPPPSQSLS